MDDVGVLQTIEAEGRDKQLFSCEFTDCCANRPKLNVLLHVSTLQSF